MGKSELFVMRVEHDPRGVLPKGARISYSKFLDGVRTGAYPEGMRVTKVARVSDFTVAVSELGSPILLDGKDVPWYIESNYRNKACIQARRDGRRLRKVCKAQSLGLE